MMAYASVSGGVIFVPEEIEQKIAATSYREFLKEQAEAESKNFGKKKSQKQPLQKAA